MNIEDLRLPCKHGYYEGTYHWNQGQCLGKGRVPTRAELIDILGIDYEAATKAWAQDYGDDGLGGFTDEAIRCLVYGALGVTDD